MELRDIYDNALIVKNQLLESLNFVGCHLPEVKALGENDAVSLGALIEEISGICHHLDRLKSQICILTRVAFACRWMNDYERKMLPVVCKDFPKDYRECQEFRFDMVDLYCLFDLVDTHLKTLEDISPLKDYDPDSFSIQELTEKDLLDESQTKFWLEALRMELQHELIAAFCDLTEEQIKIFFNIRLLGVHRRQKEIGRLLEVEIEEESSDQESN